ncbi:MAG: hypothetical protein ACE5GO_07210 [Anaerolineales bacterium]
METSPPGTLFVVEKHPLMREVLCATVDEEADLQVVGTAATPAGAIARAQPLAPATIPALRGALPRTRILALVSADVPGQDEVARELGAHAVLTKAGPREALLHALRTSALRHGPLTPRTPPRLSR